MVALSSVASSPSFCVPKKTARRGSAGPPLSAMTTLWAY